MPDQDDGSADRPTSGSATGEQGPVAQRPFDEPGRLVWTSWAASAARHPWRALTRSRRAFRRIAVIIALVLAVSIGVGVLVAVLRGDVRGYRDQMTTYVSNATQHDASGAAPYTCAAIRTAFEADAERWDEALADQDLALGHLRLAQQRLRSAPDMASVPYEREAGGDITLHIPVVEEDGDLLMCPDPEALFGRP